MNRLSSVLGFGAAIVATAVSFAQGAEVRRFDVTLQASVANLPSKAAAVDLWVPVPSEGDGQRVSEVHVSGDHGVAPPDGAIGSDKTFGNRIYHQRFTGPFTEGRTPTVALSFQVERTEFVIESAKRLDPTADSAVPPELAPYLQATAKIPLDGPVAKLHKSLDLPHGDTLRAARQIYDHLLERMAYNWKAPGAGQGDTVWACDSRTGDCTDYHSVFIGVCRVHGIPADHEFGLPVAKGKASGRATHMHCWATFWAPEIGWVPIDASEADKHAELREYNFGALSPHFIRMTHGRDVVLEPPQAGPPLNMFHGPYAEVDGKPCETVEWSADWNEMDVKALGN